MEQDEKLRMVYDQINTSTRYFLDWRNKLFVGYIVIISALYYFILTWVSKPENFTLFVYIISCFTGVIITVFFFLLNFRNNKVIWIYQNNGYMYEKRLGVIYKNKEVPLHGLFGAIIYK